MQLRIRRLECNVTIRTGQRRDITQGPQGPENPSMAYAMPFGGLGGESSAPPGEMALGDNAASSGQSQQSTSASAADPRAVAERVYDLMKDEVRLEKLRSGRN